MLLNFLKLTSTVNNAADANSMRSALEENADALGIDVSETSDYGKLKVDLKLIAVTKFGSAAAIPVIATIPPIIIPANNCLLLENT
ncbi:hypothetical protein DNHGIG_12040 [Collibacillus ludicampi]|uniref:Uncharacterized protein n=1 Tax=Collibacillus ludicampi TaxID=2771369 RepID=A0AAV4LCU7_9BACL|nr:hypothetical protein [Collibacillus ludicampi]GIM45655.1 hypothetical protein DNHGIG_12040 [Collibacillus ludicampi]